LPIAWFLPLLRSIVRRLSDISLADHPVTGRLPAATMSGVKTPRILALAAAAAFVVAVAACNSAPASSPAVGDASAGTGAPSAAAAVDAKAVLAALTAANLGVSNGAVQDENTDPNNLLGRPNGYTSRASFDLPGGDSAEKKYDIGRGGVIEVWPDATAAKGRADYITNATKSIPALAEYDYVNGPVLVRVTGKVKPSAAGKVQVAVKALKV
jgi:hypothetical protein